MIPLLNIFCEEFGISEVVKEDFKMQFPNERILLLWIQTMRTLFDDTKQKNNQNNNEEEKNKSFIILLCDKFKQHWGQKVIKLTPDVLKNKKTWKKMSKRTNGPNKFALQDSEHESIMKILSKKFQSQAQQELEN